MGKTRKEIEATIDKEAERIKNNIRNIDEENGWEKDQMFDMGDSITGVYRFDLDIDNADNNDNDDNNNDDNYKHKSFMSEVTSMDNPSSVSVNFHKSDERVYVSEYTLRFGNIKKLNVRIHNLERKFGDFGYIHNGEKTNENNLHIICRGIQMDVKYFIEKTNHIIDCIS